MRDQAQDMGYTVVDAGTVVATHISHLIHTHSAELLGRHELQQLIDYLAKVCAQADGRSDTETVAAGYGAESIAEPAG